MKESPILFSGEMVRAILDGRKTQTRRVMKTQPPDNFWRTGGIDTAGEYAYAVPLADDEKDDHLVKECKFPYGNIGDRLWVRESFFAEGQYVRYRAEGRYTSPHARWKPSIFMPRWASRITLEITGIRVERLNDISEEDAQAEGVPDELAWSAVRTMEGVENLLSHNQKIRVAEMAINPPITRDWRGGFHRLWASINGKDSLHENPFVWVIEFKRIVP